MRLINKSARLITITHGGKKYKLMPAGKSVEFPAEEAKKCKFLQILAKQGDVEIVAYEDESEGDDPLAELREEAKALGIQGVTKRWGEEKLTEAIEKAKADKDEE